LKHVSFPFDYTIGNEKVVRFLTYSFQTFPLPFSPPSITFGTKPSTTLHTYEDLQQPSFSTINGVVFEAQVRVLLPSMAKNKDEDSLQFTFGRKIRWFPFHFVFM
jgi:hypothetical protein